MKDWFTYNILLKLFVWWGHRVMGYDTITVHLNKSKEAVIGITFGEYED
jgi:hypothetical protein